MKYESEAPVQGKQKGTGAFVSSSAYKDEGDSDWADSDSVATSDDEWIDIDTATPDVSTTPPAVPQSATTWFTVNGQAAGTQHFPADLYRLIYERGAIDLDLYHSGPDYGLAGYNILFVPDGMDPADANGVDFWSWFHGLPDPVAVAHLAHTIYPGPWATGGGDRIGLYYNNYTNPSGAGTPATFTLQRRLPHVAVSVAADSTTEGDYDHPALLRFTRDQGRLGDDLTIHYRLENPGGSADPGDYSGTLVTPGLNGDPPARTTLNLASGQLTIPAGRAYVEVELIANNDTESEWTEDVQLTILEDETYICPPEPPEGPAHPNRCDAMVLLLDNDLSFSLHQGTLVANYDDDDNDGASDYDVYSNDGGTDDDLYELTLNLPATAKPGATVLLEAPADFFRLYRSNSKDQPIPPDSPGSGTYSWGSSEAPHSVWLEVLKGSQTIDDVFTRLSTDDHGVGQADWQVNTAVNLIIEALTDPNNEGFTQITNKERKWLIGQHADMHVTVQAPLEWTDDAQYEWSIPGNVMEYYRRAMTKSCGW